MAKQKIYGIMDVETGSCDNSCVYDIGLVIATKKEVFSGKRWLVKEVITNPEAMIAAYYHKKLYTQYIPMLGASEANSLIFPWETICREFNSILERYGVTTLTAYNMAFDVGAIQKTGIRCGWEDNRKFLERSYEYFDLWAATCMSVFKQKAFQKVAMQEGWLTAKGNFKTSAEVAYRYISGQYKFEEEHMALEDCYIEARILQAVMKQKKKIVRNRFIGSPWRIPQIRY